MNCKPGDIAVVVGDASVEISHAFGTETAVAVKPGTVLQVTRFAVGSSIKKRRAMWHVSIKHVDVQYSIGFARCNLVALADSILRPLRPGGGEDETLTWAGKPAQRDATLTPKKQVEHGR